MLNMPLMALLLCCLSLGWTSAARAESLRIATEGAYPPFNYIDEQGNLVGFDVDIGKALCNSMKVHCEFVAVEWGKLLDGLEAGFYDVVLASMADTPERRNQALFTDTYYRSHSSFVGDPSRFADLSPVSLSKMRLAAESGTIQAAYLHSEYPGSVVVTPPTQPDVFTALARGEADLVLADSISILMFLKSPEGQQFDFINYPLDTSKLNSTAHIAVGKQHPELVQRINQAINNIRLNGDYDRINRKYFPFSVF